METAQLFCHWIFHWGLEGHHVAFYAKEGNVVVASRLSGRLSYMRRSCWNRSLRDPEGLRLQRPALPSLPVFI